MKNQKPLAPMDGPAPNAVDQPVWEDVCEVRCIKNNITEPLALSSERILPGAS